jgi:ATP-dependent RNA helicase DeaD
MNQEEQPLFPKMEPLEADSSRKRERGERDFERDSWDKGHDRTERGRDRERNRDRERGNRGERERGGRDRDGSFSDMEPPENGMERYYLGVGKMDNVSPRDIVGAIANEADIESKYIGHIKLFEKFSTVDLPEAMPEEVLQVLRRMTIKNRPSKIRLMTSEPPARKSFGGRKPFRGDDQPPRRTRRFGRH